MRTLGWLLLIGFIMLLGSACVVAHLLVENPETFSVTPVPKMGDGTRVEIVEEVLPVNDHLVTVITDANDYPAISTDTDLKKGMKVRVTANAIHQLGHGNQVIRYAERADKKEE